MKKIISAIICVVLLFSVAAPVLATETISPVSNSLVSPRYSYINSAQAYLSISGKTASVSGYITASTDTKSVKIICTLQRQNGGSWLSLKSWTGTSSSSVANVSGSTGITSGTFRVLATYSATGANGTETGTIYSSEETA